MNANKRSNETTTIKVDPPNNTYFTFLPGLTSLKATSAAVLAAAMTSAALPVIGPSCKTWVWATMAMNPSI